MEVQAKLQIGNNDAQLYTKEYNVVDLFCHYKRQTSNSRPDTDAYCFAIEEEYHIDKQMRRTVKLSLVADKVTFEGATFQNPYNQ